MSIVIMKLIWQLSEGVVEVSHPARRRICALPRSQGVEKPPRLKEHQKKMRDDVGDY